jgi:hypothetical protein
MCVRTCRDLEPHRSHLWCPECRDDLEAQDIAKYEANTRAEMAAAYWPSEAELNHWFTMRELSVPDDPLAVYQEWFQRIWAKEDET